MKTIPKQTIDSFNGNEQSALVFLDRYAAKDEKGYPIELTWDDLCDRIYKYMQSKLKTNTPYSKNLGKAIKAMKEMKFIPGGRILSSVGSNENLTLYNCLTLPRPQDNLEDIARLDKELMFSHKRGAGVGFRIDSLRPEGQYLLSSGGKASGAVSFMRKYNASADVICQGGSRRGATLINMSVQHPEIRKFIRAKDTEGNLYNMNISVMVNDEFMEAQRKRQTYELKFPVADDIYKDGKCKVSNIVGARDLWQDICMSAWKSGDPCLQMWDRMQEYCNHQYCSPIESTNACSEIPLPSYGLCLLGAINFAKFIDDGGNLNESDLVETVRVSTIFLDSLIELELFPLEQSKSIQRSLRKIGLGFVGLAEACIRARKVYGSEDALIFTEQLVKLYREAAYKTSIELSRELGSFKSFNLDGYNLSKFVKDLPFDIHNEIAKHGIRNSTILSCQPTGTTSILAGTSSGIEPVFMREYVRNDRIGRRYVSDPVWEKYKATELAKYIVTAHEVAPKDRVEMQATVQQYIDQAISSTVNLPNSATPFDVMEIYDLAYDKGLKNITVFRDGCKAGVMESSSKEKCLSCGSDYLKYEQGCLTCLACGWSKCDI